MGNVKIPWYCYLLPWENLEYTNGCPLLSVGTLHPSTAWKVSKYWIFSGPYLPAFGLNAESYSISLCIQPKCGKIRTRKNFVFGHFSEVKLMTGNFTGVPIMNIIPDWESEVVDHPGLKKKKTKNKKNPRRLMLLWIKWGLFRKKNPS